ncbi:hypothetical protein LMH87_001879 [Akanthomyces muscarius]|uniref:Uncharacterized protein n=1 Tax=Akanthomyces muscarius TaxID=2231603 RepID=A0A9W8Q6L9_AKAMU|nr:hypothetical protein LMH87_001879 [Akanthomyces muscarius]KAJ4147349.1 hypothetical protein LMH87_001879 [Akanthomyces muscarius]
MFVNEYCTGVIEANGAPRCLRVAILYRSNNHQSTNSAEVTHIQHNTRRPCCPPPSYESLPPPAYDSLSPSPPDYESIPPPPYESLPPPPPPYKRLPCSDSSSTRPTLPPISALLSSMGSAASYSPPPPYTRLPLTTTTAAATAAAPRFPIFHTRYYSASDRQDSSQDRHKLYILTGEDNPRARGIYLHITGTRRRRNLCCRETPGDVPENTRGLRESTLLGSVSADDLDELVSLCRQGHLDLLAKSSTSRKRGPLRSKGMSCRFLLYTLEMPPPPYSKNRALEPLASASPSQEWVAAVIALVFSSGLLQRI